MREEDGEDGDDEVNVEDLDWTSRKKETGIQVVTTIMRKAKEQFSD